VDQFSEGVLAEDRTINRKALGEIVFKNPDQMKKLTDIVWPEIGARISDKIKEFREQPASEAAESNKKRVMVIEAAVLVEANWHSIPDVIWTVEVPEEVAIARLIERNKLSRDAALTRIRSQVSNETRRKIASVVIDTDRPKEDTQVLVLQELTKLLES
jgi:dephospho-CoA kinase